MSSFFLASQNNIASKKLLNDGARYDAALLLLGEGANNSTSIIDSSISARTINVFGNAKISTATFPTGMSSSILFDGSGDYLTTSLPTDLKIGSGSFTLEFYLYRNNTNDSCIYTTRSISPDFNGWMIGIRTNRVFLLASINGTSWGLNTYTIVQGPTLNASQWYHIAMSKSGSNWQVYVNGTLGYTGVLSGTITETTSTAFIASDELSTGVPQLNGYISNFRIVKNISVYNNNFTPSIPLDNAVFV